MMAWKPTTAVTSGAAAAVYARNRHISSIADELKKEIEKVAKQYVPSLKLPEYMSLSPKIEKKQCSILEGMKASTVEVICDEPRIRAIRLGNGAKLVKADVAGDTIYERDFYPQLVRDMRTLDLRVLLLGNSGVGKSMFQFYLLARYMNPALFDDMGSVLPAEQILFGSAAPPKVVIRQLPGEFHVLFLEEGVAHHVSSQDVLKCFDPATTLYFYEPGRTHGVEPVGDIHELPTLATTSPDESRYKEFCKEATTMYSPVYTMEELLAIGRDMRQPARGFRSNLGNLYSDDNISQRFDLYGGIFRFVLPRSVAAVGQYAKKREAFFQKTDFAKMVDVPSSELVHREAGTFALLYDVCRRDDGTWDFLDHSFKYAGMEVERKIREAYTKMDFAKMLQALRSADEFDTKGDNIPWKFEEVVAQYLTASSGVRWELRSVGTCIAKVPPRLEGKLTLDNALVPYHKMEVNTLYRPLESRFPLCDMMYKDEEGTLVCIQVSWSPIRMVDNGPLGKFCHAVGLCADKGGNLTETEIEFVKERVLFVYCPRPRHYRNADVQFNSKIMPGGAVMCMGQRFTSGMGKGEGPSVGAKESV